MLLLHFIFSVSSSSYIFFFPFSLKMKRRVSQGASRSGNSPSTNAGDDEAPGPSGISGE